MTKKSYEAAELIFRKNNGILRTGEAKKLGIHEAVLIQMRNDGLLVQESRGLYRLSDLPPLSNPDLIQVALRIPNAVVCLISALNFFQLTTQIPYMVFIALPRETKAPRIQYPPLDIVYLSKKPYLAGVEEHILSGVSVNIYSKEKTIADCFKFRNKIGLDVALEGLKDYLRSPDANIQSLMNYARINRVEKTIQPYIQAIL